MSAYSNQLAWAAKTAQKVLAPMSDPSGNGEFTIAGLTGTWTGVVAEDPNMLIPTTNGIQKVYGVRVVAIRSQFDAASIAAAQLANVAFARAKLTANGKTWNLREASPQAVHYQFVAVIAT